MSHKPNMDLNTIFAGVLIAGITGLLASFISRQVISPEYPHEAAFPIEVIETAVAGEAAGPVGPEPILALLATADVAKGESLHKQCAACHSFDKGGPNRVGPNLWGVVGRPKGSHEGFAYSEELKGKGGTWTYDDLNHFLWKPKSYIAGTKMNYAGIKKPEDRAALIAWLRSQGDNALALPSDAEIAAETAKMAPETPATEAAEGSETQATEAKVPPAEAAGAVSTTPATTGVLPAPVATPVPAETKTP